MIDILLASSFVSFALLVWFQTNAFVEYFFFLPIVKQYLKAKEAGIAGLFVNFLALNYDSFFTRLVTCPYCLNFWFSLVACFFVGWKFFALIYILSMLYYKVIALISHYESR